VRVLGFPAQYPDGGTKVEFDAAGLL